MGDAIHAMPPVGGMGGNMALCDASRLCDALQAAARGEAGLAEALGAYEDEMLTRGFGAVREARLYLRLAISRSRLLRMTARTFFRACGSIPPLRRAVFG
jgi:2-polyprenyl-6-methoxyphenol hydroxylase-like FAD-dependent oxidoreductase